MNKGLIASLILGAVAIGSVAYVGNELREKHLAQKQNTSTSSLESRVEEKDLPVKSPVRENNPKNTSPAPRIIPKENIIPNAEDKNGKKFYVNFLKQLRPLDEEKIASGIIGNPTFRKLYLSKMNNEGVVQGVVPYQEDNHFINIHFNRDYRKSIVEEVFGQLKEVPEDFLRISNGPLKGSLSKLYLINPETAKCGKPIGWIEDLGIRTMEIKDANGASETDWYRLKKFIDLNGKIISPWYLGVDAWGHVIIRYSDPNWRWSAATLESPQYSYLTDEEREYLDVFETGKVDISKIRRGYEVNKNFDLVRQVGWLIEVDRAADVVRRVRLDRNGDLIHIEDVFLPQFTELSPWYLGGPIN